MSNVPDLPDDFQWDEDPSIPTTWGCQAEPCKDPVWPDVASYVRERDGMTCRYCGMPVVENGGMHFDHVRPRSRGGTSMASNVVIACRTCNLRKSDRTPTEAGMPLLPIPRPRRRSR